jgi:hypothetical protein
MPAPFFISAGDRAGPIDAPRGLPTIEAAVVAARAFREAHPRAALAVYGDGYDCDCDEDGYFMNSDGLTDDEREQLEEAGCRG